MPSVPHLPLNAGEKAQYHCPLATAAQLYHHGAENPDFGTGCLPASLTQSSSEAAACLQLGKLVAAGGFILWVGISGLHGVNAQCRLEILLLYCYSFLFVGENM